MSTGPHGVTWQISGTQDSVQNYNDDCMREVINSVNIMTWLLCVVKLFSPEDGYQHFGAT
jgi:hypothetical protein